MTRQHLPNRRPSMTVRAVWKSEMAEHPFHVTAGFEPESGAIREVFYADGQRTGSNLRDTVQDACILISLLLQHGATLEEIGRNLSVVRLFGEVHPATIVGVIVAKLKEMEG